MTSAIIIGVVALLFIISVFRRPSEKERTSIWNTNQVYEIRLTEAEITNRKVRFFDQSGKPLVGYVRKEKNRIHLFSAPNGKSPFGDAISPVTREIIDSYVEQLKAEVSKSTHQISPSLADLTNEVVQLFDQDGKPLVGYVQKDGNITLFSEPKGFSPLGDELKAIDRKTAQRYIRQLEAEVYKSVNPVEIKPTLDELINGSVSFFDQDGQALIGYQQNEFGTITLFSKRGGLSSLGVPVLPVTPYVVKKYIEMRQGDAALQEEDEKRVALIREVEKNLAQQERESGQFANYRDHYIADKHRYDLAVFVVDETGEQNLAVSSFMSEFLAKNGLKTTPGSFKPAFIKDGLFKEAFSGQSDVLKRLPLKDAASSILLGQQSVSYTTNSQLDNLITATMKFEVNALYSSTLQSFGAKTIQVNGAGFTPNDARTMAENRALSQLTNGSLDKIQMTASTRKN